MKWIRALFHGRAQKSSVRRVPAYPLREVTSDYGWGFDRWSFDHELIFSRLDRKLRLYLSHSLRLEPALGQGTSGTRKPEPDDI